MLKKVLLNLCDKPTRKKIQKTNKKLQLRIIKFRFISYFVIMDTSVDGCIFFLI